MNKYLKAISINLIFFAISSAAFLILTPLAIKVMGDEFFGLWSIIIAILQFTNIGTLGIGLIVNKISSEKNISDPKTSSIISSALIVSSAAAFVTFIILLGVRNALVDNINPPPAFSSQFKSALIIYGVSIFPIFINEIFYGYYLSQLRNTFVKSMGLIYSISPWIGGVIISLFVKNLVLLSVWNLFVQLVILTIFIMTTMRSIKWEWLPDKAMLKKILGFSKFMIIESSANTLFQRFGRILVGITLGSVAAGVYSVATSIGLRLEMVSIQATQTMIPFASLKNSLGENEVLYQTYRKLSKYISLMIAGLASFLILWMSEILSLWISVDYSTQYYSFFIILILAYGFKSLSYPAYQTLIGLGQVKFNSLMYLLLSVLLISSLYFLSRMFGLGGAALANLVMVILLFMNLWTYKVLNKELAWRHVISDLKWGVAIPTLAYVIHLFRTPWYIRITFTLILGLFSLLIIKNDPFILNQLKRITQKFLRRQEA